MATGWPPAGVAAAAFAAAGQGCRPARGHPHRARARARVGARPVEVRGPGSEPCRGRVPALSPGLSACTTAQTKRLGAQELRLPQHSSSCRFWPDLLPGLLIMSAGLRAVFVPPQRSRHTRPTPTANPYSPVRSRSCPRRRTPEHNGDLSRRPPGDRTTTSRDRPPAARTRASHGRGDRRGRAPGRGRLSSDY